MVSKHITEREAYGSATATRLHIDNTPNAEQLAALQLLAEKVFEPLREWVGEPIKINSMFRSLALNAAIGGAKGSQHCAENGAAIDIDDDCCARVNNADMFHWLRDNVDFDQLIWEFGDESNPDWVHVSYKREGNNRKQVLKATRKDGRTIYSAI